MNASYDSPKDCYCDGCCSNSGACLDIKIEKKLIAENLISGYINIYDTGGVYQAMSAIYDTEDRAIETGKIVRGYIGTVFIKLPKEAS